MKVAGIELTPDQKKMYLALSTDTPVQAMMPKGQIVTLRPIPHYNSLDWGFTIWFEGKQVGGEYSHDEETLFMQLFSQLRGA